MLRAKIKEMPEPVQRAAVKANKLYLVPAPSFQVPVKSPGVLVSVQSETVLNRLRAFAFNSSHFVWMISDLSFFESTNGWIFALTKKLGVTLVALEPLPPTQYFLDEDFFFAVKELQNSVLSGPISFVSIGERFSKLLNQEGFYNIQIGKEPWVDLSDYEPDGKKHRGMRAAKKQAMSLGFKVETWKLSDLHRNPTLRAQIETIHARWLNDTAVSLDGFLLKTDPWKLMDDRICFLVKKPGGDIEAVLIATPIRQHQSWYFEDMWFTEKHSRGLAEFITLEAMRVLKLRGATSVSLGLVPMVDLNFSNNPDHLSFARPHVFAASVEIFVFLAKTFYNSNGMYNFRKRFKVKTWTPTYLSVQTSSKSFLGKSAQWGQVMIALFLAHCPKLNLRFKA